MATDGTNAQPSCASARAHNDYDTAAQIGGLFLILAVSALGCAFPIAVKRWSWIKIPPIALFYCRHIGTGVIIATCFVHLVPTAFINMLNPCLPLFWIERFPAMPGLIMMLGLLLIATIDFAFQSNGVEHSHQSELADLADASPVTREDLGLSPTVQRPGEGDLEEQGLDLKKDGEGEQLRQCALLEGGILCHSIFIGMAIAFSSGPQFAALLIAISFHQILEGLALGSRIAAIRQFGPGSFKPWVMVIGYGLTAPIGQAIGLGVHGTFDLESQSGLLMVGIANAFSSGLLIYAGLIQLLYEDFFSEHGRNQLKGRRIWACMAFLVGVAGMTIIGAWA